MMKPVHQFSVVALCVVLLALTPRVSYAQNTAADIPQLTKEMYRYYNSDLQEQFFSVTDKLKAAARAADDERLFYKTWCNQALYTNMKVGRVQGIGMAQDIYHYAREHDSKFGLYTATYALGCIHSAAGRYDKATDDFHKAIDIQQEFFPTDSRAAAWLGMCKAAYNLRHFVNTIEYANNVLSDAKAIPMHRLNALTYKTLSCFTINDSIGFERTYEMRKKVLDSIGHDDTFGTLVEVQRARLHRNWDKAVELTNGLNSGNKILQMVNIYEAKGDYKQAFIWLSRHKRRQDSISNAEVMTAMADFDTEMALHRAENESKDLRLANQQLLLQQVSGALERQRMESEASALKLRNAAIQMQNDSLERSEQAAKISEYQSRIVAQQQAERARRLGRIALIVIAAIIVIASAIIVYRRHRQMQRLKTVNQQLRNAYDQLEEATTARERIESELRIARDIQMGMVPQEFPQRPDLDLYAMMTPAKEVGGDLYSYVMQDDGQQLYFCVGDVSGKGVPASLFMAQVTRMFRTLTDGHLSPAAIATRMNNAMTEGNEQGMFVTMFIGLVDLRTGHLDFCNAGHNPPLLDGQYMEMEPNAPIGLWPGLEYEGEELASIKGKTLFIYTDGLNEAENRRQEQFGDDRLQQLLTTAHGTARQTAEYVHQKVEEFVDGAEQSDDMTKLCIKVL